MFKVLVLILIITSVFSQNDFSEQESKLFVKFQKFIATYGKQYNSHDEFKNRYEVFKSNYFATKNERSETGYEIGTTQFSDITKEEFQEKYLNLKLEEAIPADAEFYNPDSDNTSSTKSEFLQDSGRNLQSIPSSWDWRSYGVVTSVKSQGSCGGCWSFSAAANIEGLYARKYGKLVSFSEQQMIDCDNANSGCGGGVISKAFDYIKNAGGLMTSSIYPFTGYRGTCKFKLSQAAVKVTGYKFASSTNEDTIKQMLYTLGPLAATMNATNLQSYKSGIINTSYSQCPYAPNHGVTLVGYGTANGVNYWIVKNSWGSNWGENGYFRIARGTGLCGINKYVVSATIS